MSEEINRIVSGTQNIEDIDNETDLRPKWIDDYIGQDKIKNQHVSTEIEYSYFEMWADEWSGTYEIYELISDNSVDFDDFDLYPDSLVFKGITDENYIYLSHLDY